MNLQQLEYFKIVAKTQNFTAASNLFLVTQPALSKAISKLEDELKVPLFEKHGRNIKLTRFGSMFLKHVDIALDEINEGIEELQNIISPIIGTVSIASLYTIGTNFMPTIISDFLKDSPNTKFEFCMESTTNIIKGLIDGQFDLGFYDEFEYIENFEEIESVPIKNDEFVVIMPKNHHFANRTEIALEDLIDENFVFFSETLKNKMCSIFEKLGFTPKVSMSPNENSMTVITGFVSAGLGISIVPNTPDLKIDELSVLRIKEKQCYRTVHIGWLKNGYMTPSAEKFKDFVIAVASKMKI